MNWWNFEVKRATVKVTNIAKNPLKMHRSGEGIPSAVNCWRQVQRSILCIFSSCRTMVILQRHGNMSCWASCSISYGNFVEMAKCIVGNRNWNSYTAMRTKITLKCVCVMLPAEQPSNFATKCVPRSRSFHEQKFDKTIRRKWEWKWVAFMGTEIRMGLTWEW